MNLVSKYTITFARSARKELEALDAAIFSNVFRRIEALADFPRPDGCRKIRGERTAWRIRVGDYRVIYAIDDTNRNVDIIAVRHRSDAYR
ncbi:MAG: type II toxin-antitoxin system RelE/ParE family toxin [Candidatus Latescibacter sp.]|nr:type II toxin-antitoxin system RelE/ParE family toxin [Candidatus Latescibacter sp.]